MEVLGLLHEDDKLDGLNSLATRSATSLIGRLNYRVRKGVKHGIHDVGSRQVCKLLQRRLCLLRSFAENRSKSH